MKLIQLARLCAGFFLLCLLGACATPQTTRLLISEPGFHPRAAQLNVPFVAQQESTCGPTALAMVLQAHGKTVDMPRLLNQGMLPERSGTLQIEMLAMTRRQGLLAYRLDPDMARLLSEVSQGHSPIVLVNLSFNWWPRWHYVVVTGFDLDKKIIRVHSAGEANQEWSLSTFERLWARSDYWAYLAMGPKEWPVGVDENRYVKAAIDLERGVGLNAAGWAYQQALEKWPQNLSALVGQGNFAYQQGNKQEASVYYRKAIDANPDSKTAANNLAQTLLDLGELSEARQWAERAISLGAGASAEETLLAIQQKQAALRNH